MALYYMLSLEHLSYFELSSRGFSAHRLKGFPMVLSSHLYPVQSISGDQKYTFWGISDPAPGQVITSILWYLHATMPRNHLSTRHARQFTVLWKMTPKKNRPNCKPYLENSPLCKTYMGNSPLCKKILGKFVRKFFEGIILQNNVQCRYLVAAVGLWIHRMLKADILRPLSVLSYEFFYSPMIQQQASFIK